MLKEKLEKIIVTQKKELALNEKTVIRKIFLS